MYVAADIAMTPSVRAAAALLTVPDPSFVSHVSSARVQGVPVPAIADEHVTVLRGRDRRSRPGIVCHFAPSGRVITRDGVRVSAPAQCFCELAAQLSLVDLVVAGDWLVRRRRVTRAQLVDAAQERVGAGAARAREAAAYVRSRVDSPMETRLRMLLLLAGLPEPRVNLELTDDTGQVIRRYDLSYPSVRVAVEYDGRQHVEREQNWEADLDRREASDDDGWRIIVVTSRGIYREPERTLARVHRLVRARRLAGVPAALDDTWRAHFPVNT